MFAPYDPDFDASLRRQQDIPQAKALLKKAGHENLTVTLTTSAIATATVALATVLKEQAAAAGCHDQPQPGRRGHLLWQELPQLDIQSGLLLIRARYLNQVAQSFVGAASQFNETHSYDTHYLSLYNQANATKSASTRKQILFEMQKLDFTQGAYIIPTFMDTLDASCSTTLAGYTTAKPGELAVQLGFRALLFRLTREAACKGG